MREKKLQGVDDWGSEMRWRFFQVGKVLRQVMSERNRKAGGHAPKILRGVGYGSEEIVFESRVQPVADCSRRDFHLFHKTM